MTFGLIVRASPTDFVAFFHAAGNAFSFLGTVDDKAGWD
jgi:hypothetical protein